MLADMFANIITNTFTNIAFIISVDMVANITYNIIATIFVNI